MTKLTLVIGNKNYSSWSLRPWLAMKQAGLEFAEVHISLYTPTSRQEILQYSAAGKVPILIDDELKIWESLAICEYIAEQFDASLLPEDSTTRAIARSISSEMHAGFSCLRQSMPMNCRARLPMKNFSPELQADIARINMIWRDCRHNFGQSGDFLFGNFTIADAMFAPVVLRFLTYDVQLEKVEQAYADAILQLPTLQSWLNDAHNEEENIADFEL